MQLSSSIDSFPCFIRLNPCVAHCSTDSIPWVHHSREEGSLDYDGRLVRLQIHMDFDTIIYRQHGSTKVPSGFLVNHRKPRELGVASANRHSWLGSHEVPARPWFCGSTKKPSMTSSCCSCHHAARTWPRWPPGPSNEAYLSSPHLEASSATTFGACSSPAPTPVMPQPAPAILSQESVHTMLSITHHTRKRPSTDPRTTHGPQFSSSPAIPLLCWPICHERLHKDTPSSCAHGVAFSSFHPGKASFFHFELFRLVFFFAL
jgi:hypothetical protein